MNWYVEVMRWFFGAFLVVFGVVLILGRHTIANARRFFPCSLFDEQTARRVQVALDARVAIEGEPAAGWIVCGALWIVLGLLTFTNALSFVLGYALGCAASAVVLAWYYLRMRNTAPRRAAVLTPRTHASALPYGWYAVALLAALLPLAFVTVARFSVSAVIVSAAALATFSIALAIAQMPAILLGVDATIEAFIEQRLRTMRVSQAIALVFCESFVFAGVAAPLADGAYGLVSLTAWAVWMAFIAWLLAVQRRSLAPPTEC